jgi:hypothetical protein
MYSRIITAVVLSAAFMAPAMAGVTIANGHSDCYRGKCATVTHSHGAMAGSSHGAMAGSSHGAMAGSSHGAMSTHDTSNIATKPH